VLPRDCLQRRGIRRSEAKRKGGYDPYNQRQLSLAMQNRTGTSHNGSYITSNYTARWSSHTDSRLLVVIVQEILDHIRSIQPIPKSTIIITRTNTYCISFAIISTSISLPEITAILPLPCSSLAIRSASSINNVPTPYSSA
jgi:hypothetical protein